MLKLNSNKLKLTCALQYITLHMFACSIESTVNGFIHKICIYFNNQPPQISFTTAN